MQLTERQWRDWSPQRRLALLTGDLDASLKVGAARQLAWINDCEPAREAANLYLGPGGPFDRPNFPLEPTMAKFLYHLAKVDASSAAESIRRVLDDMDDVTAIPASVWRSFVETLEEIAFLPSTFHEAARLLLRLAVDETETEISNNATGQFAALFPVFLGATAADGDARRSLLEEVTNTDDPKQRKVVSDALLAGSQTTHFSRFVGAESHGSRPALTSWHPGYTDAAEYIQFCVERLAQEATAADDVGAAVRNALGHELRGLVGFGLVDIVEATVEDVRQARRGWPEAIVSLGDFLRFDAGDVPSDLRSRVSALIGRLQPETLTDRVRELVSNMPWDYPNGEDLDYDTQVCRQLQTVRAIAAEVLGQVAVLAELLPQLCTGTQRQTGVFAESLGEHIDAPEDWLPRVVDALLRIPDESRNFNLLTGFLKGMSARAPHAVQAFKQEVAGSPSLAVALPEICFPTWTR